jgi:pimeloyl-ACP methyl ester carboxylesterase
MPELTTSDGVKLHYEDLGSGPPIVFSAGWAMDGSWWRHQMGFASDHRLVVLDPRSQGESEKVVRGLRMGRQAADLRELFDALDLADVTLVAWSRSTSISLAYWELFGDHRLGRLVLIGVTPSMSKREDWEWGFMMDPVAFQSLIMADHEGVVRQVITDLLLTAPPSDEVETMVRNTMLTPPLAGARMLEDHGVIDWRDMLHTVTIPVLVCVGRYDRNAPLPAAEYVAEAVPNGQLAIFEKSAHAPFYEEPEEFNRVLEAFLAEGLGREEDRA